VGAGAGTALCTAGALPADYVASNSDCAPADAGRWQLLSYAFVDGDGDGYTVAAAGQLCSGAALPPGYLNSGNGNDCNDGDASLWRNVVLYPDQDGDGVGVTPYQVQCLGATLPAGFSIYGDDADDGNASITVDDDDIEDTSLIL
jgi:hypothetical protein